MKGKFSQISGKEINEQNKESTDNGQYSLRLRTGSSKIKPSEAKKKKAY